MTPETARASLSEVVLAYNRTQNIHFQLTNQPLPTTALTSSIIWDPLSNPNHPSPRSSSPSYKVSVHYADLSNSIQIFPITSPHSVCVVQTFRNLMTPPMLYLFIEYYLSIGWNVILFDRHGFHQDLIQERYSANSSVIYYPFTIHQLLFPEKYSTSTSTPDEVRCFHIFCVTVVRDSSITRFVGHLVFPTAPLPFYRFP